MVAHLHLIWHQICKGLKENSRATDTIQRRTHREGRWAILVSLLVRMQKKKQDFERVYGAERGFQLFYPISSWYPTTCDTHCLLTSIRFQSNMAPPISPMKRTLLRVTEHDSFGQHAALHKCKITTPQRSKAQRVMYLLSVIVSFFCTCRCVCDINSSTFFCLS